MTIRDRANTPLQTLRLAAAMLRSKHPETVNLANAVSRSTDRLVYSTSLLLTRFETDTVLPNVVPLTDEEIALGGEHA